MTFAVVFPGQGSQKVGMLSELAAEHPCVAEVFAEASNLFEQDLWTLAQNGPAEALADTRVTQPLMFTSGVAVWRCLQGSGLGEPVAVAGHSLGEFVALVAAGVLSFAEGCALVKQRAMFMADAVPEGEGGMAALLGMDDEDVVALCEELNGERVVQAANFNSPGQVVISGHLDALQRAVEAAKTRGARKAMMVPVSVPNHSALMQDAGAKLAELMDGLTFNEPQFPVVQNAQATAPADQAALLSSLKKHVFSPVRWTQSVQALKNDYGVSALVEAGPGKVLTGLSKRIDKSLPCLPVDSSESLNAAVNAIQSPGAGA